MFVVVVPTIVCEKRLSGRRKLRVRVRNSSFVFSIWSLVTITKDQRPTTKDDFRNVTILNVPYAHSKFKIPHSKLIQCQKINQEKNLVESF